MPKHGALIPHASSLIPPLTPGKNCPTVRQSLPPVFPDAENVSPNEQCARQDALLDGQNVLFETLDAPFEARDALITAPDEQFAGQDMPFTPHVASIMDAVIVRRRVAL